MTGDPHIGEVMEGYGVLADQLLKNWTPFLTAVSAKLAAGNYQAKDAEADFGAGAKLFVESMMAIGSEALDAAAIMSSNFDEVVVAGGYDTEIELDQVRTLTVNDDLTSKSGLTLPKDRVTLEPATLQPQCSHFQTVVNGDGIKARTYDGVVLVTKASGVVVDQVDVTVTVG